VCLVIRKFHPARIRIPELLAASAQSHSDLFSVAFIVNIAESNFRHTQPTPSLRANLSSRKGQLLIMGHSRRQILWCGVTAHPTAEWIANQLTAACGWEQILRHLIHDRDACYGSIFVCRVRSLGIRDHPTSARSPWQNGCAERLIGSIGRGCLDHVVVTGEQHLRHILACYVDYYNAVRTHLSLGKDAPSGRAIQRHGHIEGRPMLGGLHHQRVRV
jgi:transposase InsO family protein